MRRLVAIAVLAAAVASHAAAQTDVEPGSRELQALRGELVAAINAADVDRLASHVTEDVVVTWPNGDVSRGRDAARDFFVKTMKGPGSLVAEYSTEVDVEGDAIFHGPDMAVAHGRARDRLVLASGATLDLDSRWTATLVRRNGRWLVASFHTSTDLFDNPVLWKMKTTAYLLTVFGLVMGITVGIGVAMFLGRRRASRP